MLIRWGQPSQPPPDMSKPLGRHGAYVWYDGAPLIPPGQQIFSMIAGMSDSWERTKYGTMELLLSHPIRPHDPKACARGDGKTLGSRDLLGDRQFPDNGSSKWERQESTVTAEYGASVQSRVHGKVWAAAPLFVDPAFIL